MEVVRHRKKWKYLLFRRVVCRVSQKHHYRVCHSDAFPNRNEFIGFLFCAMLLGTFLVLAQICFGLWPFLDLSSAATVKVTPAWVTSILSLVPTFLYAVSNMSTRLKKASIFSAFCSSYHAQIPKWTRGLFLSSIFFVFQPRHNNMSEMRMLPLPTTGYISLLVTVSTVSMSGSIFLASGAKQFKSN
jgi:hypothetical protein